MCHAHAVLNLKQSRQQTLEVEMRHLVEIGLLADVLSVIKDLAKSRKYPVLVEKRPIHLVEHVARAIDEAKIPGLDITKKPIAPKFPNHRRVFAEQSKIWHDRLNGHDIVAVLVGAVDRCLGG